MLMRPKLQTGPVREAELASFRSISVCGHFMNIQKSATEVATSLGMSGAGHVSCSRKKRQQSSHSMPSHGSALGLVIHFSLWDRCRAPIYQAWSMVHIKCI